MFGYSRSIPLKLYKIHCGGLSKYLKPCSAISLKYNTFNREQDGAGDKKYKLYSAISLSFIGVVSYYLYGDKVKDFITSSNQVHAFNKQQQQHDVSCGVKRNDLPTYSLEQVSRHDNPKSGIWVTYKEGVYDISNFVSQHPGGQSKIMMAAGGSIDPFWMVFANHNKSEILELLESMRVGNLKAEDVYKKTQDTFDPYALEPARSNVLKVNGKQPFCAEPPSPLLVENFITPSDIFYVRNHLPVPLVFEEDYELELAIEDEKVVKTLTLDDIKKYPKYTVTSAIMCGGNRRSEMAEAKPLRGLSWSVGAIGNATWSGARLCDILEGLGIKEEDFDHVQFEGSDVDPAGIPYGASIPISKAFDPRADVILAYEMNDEPIPLDHGFPIRVIVPGVVGARNVKWLNKVIFSKNESPSQFQQNDYKGFSPSIDWHNVDFSKAPAIQEMPVTSAICVPQKGDKVPVGENGTITVKGYAWSGGGNKIIRVDVTADEGKTWHIADLVAQDKNAKEGRHYAWTLWSLELPVDKSKRQVEVWAKAVDSSYNVQPESFKNIWNLRGFLCNAYHRVKVDLS
ncbi:probable sulfite oxidase, mitochondrial isoform X2 [Copidosoma floridanum]|uniref:probable sulfite oxidase, mitochondrial isoform X2 n=1 Tax=Copidosoma floridanum TaxID=29053 RepID=UPI000C6F8EA0|nr:probable sulfite oxidase, mitochondrial isoform X2 [Copidosoma floridanum]